MMYEALNLAYKCSVDVLDSGSKLYVGVKIKKHLLNNAIFKNKFCFF